MPDRDSGTRGDLKRTKLSAAAWPATASLIYGSLTRTALTLTAVFGIYAALALPIVTGLVTGLLYINSWRPWHVIIHFHSNVQ